MKEKENIKVDSRGKGNSQDEKVLPTIFKENSFHSSCIS